MELLYGASRKKKLFVSCKRLTALSRIFKHINTFTKVKVAV